MKDKGEKREKNFLPYLNNFRILEKGNKSKGTKKN